MKRLFFLTGRSGIGKTSILIKVIQILKKEDHIIGGMITQEYREHGFRIGFKVIDVKTDAKGWLAHINQDVGPRIGRYVVNLNDLNNIGVKALLNAAQESEIIVVDEIGPMELKSTSFQEAIHTVIESEKPIIGTIHQRMHGKIVDDIRKRSDVALFEVRLENREKLHFKIVDLIHRYLQNYFSGNPGKGV